jgi:hypothetical protein
VCDYINPRDARYADARDVIVDASRRVDETSGIFLIDRASSSGCIARRARGGARFRSLSVRSFVRSFVETMTTTPLETLVEDAARARRAYESALAETSRVWMDAVDFGEDDNGTDDDASRRECASDGFDAEAVRQSSAGVATCETRAACARALVDAMDAAIGVSEFEDEDATTEKLERAAVNARRAAEYFDVVVQTGSVSSSMDIEEERAAVERANETLRRYGERACDGVRDATWKLFREKLRASGWPPSLRPTELKEFRWRLTSEDEDEADAAMKEMRFVRSFHVLRVTSETRARFAGELSFAYDDVALAFVEDLAEAIRVTFATNGSLSDPRKPERMFACAKELTQRTPALLRAELDRVVFVDEPKIAVSTTRHYLSLLIHAVCDVIRTHVCVACAESDDEPWWLHVADECRAFDEEMSKNPYSTKPETPRALDALVRHRAHADAWMECEREHALSRAAKAWNDGKNWTRNSGDNGDLEFKRRASQKSSPSSLRIASSPPWVSRETTGGCTLSTSSPYL